MEDYENKRHKYVTFYLCGSTIIHLFWILKFFVQYDYSAHFWFSLFFDIIVIIGNILIVSWKIIGFFIIFFATIAWTIVMIFFLDISPITSILLNLILILILFGVLNIKKDSISTWEILCNEAKMKKRETIVWFSVVFGLTFIYLVIATFPVKKHYSEAIPIFAPKRIIQWNNYGGWVFGNHILETEYGEIRLGHFSNINIFNNTLVVDIELFRSGRASHNLVVEEMEMPENITVWFNKTQITYLDPDYQDMVLSGVPIRTGRIHINSPSSNKPDILFYDGVHFVNEYLTLTDSTELNVGGSSLEIYKDKEYWVLENRPSWSYSLFVKHPEETEFKRYISIMFKKNWGIFINGVLFEE
jgi:hypothetical protein